MPKRVASTLLSKTKFLSGLQCLKRLYLQCHKPDLVEKPNERTRAILAQGQEVEELARMAFPGGVLIEGDEGAFGAAVEQTREIVEEREAPAIFNGAFCFKDIRVRVDILRKIPRKGWQLVEVKSTLGGKEHHLFDAALQRYVLRESGLRISGTCIMHLNRRYVFDGESYDLKRLYVTKNVSRKIRPYLRKIPYVLSDQRRALSRSNPPDLEPGRHCTSPSSCEFFTLCNEERKVNWVGFLPGLKGERLQELREMGIETMEDLPKGFHLSRKQKNACESLRRGELFVSDELQETLDTLQYPLFFMDFETYNAPIPQFEDMGPYHQIPFQWSVHVLREPGAKREHYEFLATDHEDPREEFAENLLDVLGEEGHIVVYHQSFESQRLQELADRLPRFRKRIQRVQKRLWDFLPVVRENVYHPAFRGSFSLKSVIPALIPQMTYKDLEISEGADAGLAYRKIISSELPARDRNRLRRALRVYCKQDTLGLVKMLKTFQKKKAK